MNRSYTDSYSEHCDTALGWIARFRSEQATAEDREAFALWLAADPAHQRAMDDMLDLWDDLGVVSALPFQSAVTPPAANQSRWRIGSALAAAACLMAAIALWLPDGGAPEPRQFQTAKGEQRVIELDDASTLTLNTNSRVSVRYNDDQRQLQLLEGEAYFEVTPDTNRPFSVDAGSARITVLGTAFNIERTEETTEITVSEGVVRVSELKTGIQSPRSHVLRANQRLAASPQGLGQPQPVTDDRDTAWRRGELVAHGMTLPELATELGRYSDTRILFGDAEVAALSVSGVFRLDDPEATIAAVALSLGLDTTPVDENTVLLLKAPR